MAFAVLQPQPSVSSMLDIFMAPPTEIAIESSRMVQYRPVSSLDGGSNMIEFVVPASQMYTDFSSMLLEVKLQVLKVDGTGKEVSLTATDSLKISAEQYLLHSCFEELELSLGSKILTGALGTYAFRAYIEALLSYGSDAKDSFLSAEGWVGGYPKDDTNSARSSLIRESRVVHLLGKPHLDFCHQNRLLIPMIDIRLRLLKAKDSFILMNTTVAPTKVEAKVRILECNLFLRHVTVSPDVEVAHLSALKISPALYPIRRCVVRSFPLSSGSVVGLIDNISGQVPNRIIVGLVSSQAANGRVSHSGLAFKHWNTTFLSCHLNGESVPADPIQTDFESGDYAHAYLSLFQTVGNFANNHGISPISYKDYADSNVTLWGIVLSPEGSVSEEYSSGIRQGVLRLEFHFKTPLTESLAAMVFMEFDNCVRITAQREVVLDY